MGVRNRDPIRTRETTMAIKADMKSFLAEFETLKARYGESFADLKVVRFASNGKAVRNWQDYVPYSCRTDDQGLTTCEEERPI
jgi:hypothetical protein